MIVETQMPEIKPIPKKSHKWYYFTYDGFNQVSVPQKAPQVLLKPWTEAIRISSGITIGTDGFLTVNKLGLLNCVPQDEIPAKLSVDNQFFANLTVAEHCRKALRRTGAVKFYFHFFTLNQ